MESLEALPHKNEDNRKNVAILYFTSKYFGFLVAQVILMESLEALPHKKEDNRKNVAILQFINKNLRNISCCTS